MAALVRLRNLQKLVTPALLGPRRCVGTSGNQKSESTSVSKSSSAQSSECQPKKNWVSYGFDDESEYADRHLLHLTSFIGISLVLTVGGWLLIYFPDNRYRDWAQREAYLELRRREDLGLPPIDMNLIDPAKVKLPTDEELGDCPIII